ncbi:MAG: DMT family transporter [Alistipes sp.]
MLKWSEYKYHLAALFTVTVWGATFVSTKVLLNNGLSSIDIFFFRFVLAYFCIWIVSPRKLWADNWRDELTLLGAGVSGGSLYFLLENMALEYAPASNVSLIVCTAPLWTALLLSTIYRNERMCRWQVAGSLVACAGMVLVVLNGQFVLHLSPTGDFLAFAAAVLWAFYSLIIKRIGDKYPTIFITRKIFFYGILTLLPVFAVRPLVLDFTLLVRPIVWLNILFLGVVASMLCYLLWNLTMNKLGAVRTTNYIYINPLITILTAAVFIGERITFTAVAGAVLILTGMWLVENKKLF